MVSCKQCNTGNALDSTFCKKCGAAIPSDEIHQAKAKLDDLVEQGNQLFNEGRTEESLAVADTVLASDIAHVGALSLKMLAHERLGDLAQALEVADQIVEINPDSDLDKIRRNHLRARLASSTQLHEGPDKRVAVVGGIAASVLVVCIAVLVAMALKSRPEDRVASLSKPVTEQVLPVGPSTGQSQVAPVQQTAPAPQQSSAQTAQLNPGDVGPVRSAPQSRSERTSLPTVPDGALPVAPGNDAMQGEITLRPLSPNISESGLPPVKVAGDGTKASQDPDPDKSQTFSVKEQPTEPKENPGTVEITVHSGTRNGSPQPESPDGNGVKALTRAARDQFQLGNFSAAARSLEQAIHRGGDAVTLNQRLGQAYERLGRTSDALEAYRRSVSAGQAALSSGRGSPEQIKAAVDSSQAALNRLGG